LLRTTDELRQSHDRRARVSTTSAPPSSPTSARSSRIRSTLPSRSRRERSAIQSRAARASASDHDLEYRVIAADGRIVWTLDLVRLVRHPDGTSARVFGKSGRGNRVSSRATTTYRAMLSQPDR